VEILSPVLEVINSLKWWQWALAALAALISGISKAGLKGIAVLVVSIFALVFGGKPSTGILLPLLMVADIVAVRYYHRHAQKEYLWKLLPWMFAGILLGVWLGKDLPEEIFKQGMAIIILISLGVMYWFDRKKESAVPQHWSFAGVMGVIAGFATMVGNLAGAFSAIYFLAMRLPKNHFIGTTAWLFLITNFFKAPFHIFVWHTITWDTLKFNMVLFPMTFLGFYLGVSLIRRIKDQHYRKIILLLTALAACLILFRS